MKPFKSFVTLALLAAIAGCADLPGTSQIDGSHRFGRTDFHLYPVAVLAIDGKTPMQTRANPDEKRIPRLAATGQDYGDLYDQLSMQLEPGDHMVTFSAPPAGGFHVAPSITIKFHIDPCTIYYVAAHRENRLLQEFDVVTEDVEPLAGCAIPK